MDLAEALKSSAVFSKLDKSSVDLLAAQARVRKYAKRAVLFYEGDEGASLMAIQSGRVSLDRESFEGEKQHIAERGPGDVIGEMALLDGQPRSATATALTDVSAVVLGREGFDFALKRSPDLAIEMLRCLSLRLREISDSAFNQRFASTPARLAREMVKEIESQDAEFKGRKVRFRLAATHKDLADRIGVTRETVSRQISAFREAGIITSSSGRVIVADFEALSKLAAQVSAP